MAYDAKTERLIALKKLAGKAQTSNDKGLANEGLPFRNNIYIWTIFGETITTSPSSTISVYNNWESGVRPVSSFFYCW